MAARPNSRLFLGRHFFLGGSTDLEAARAGRPPGRPVAESPRSSSSTCSARTPSRRCSSPSRRTGTASSPSWPKAASASRITSIGGVPSWLLMLFQKLLELSGKSTIAEVWPDLEMVIHGGVKFDPYRRRLRGDPREQVDPPPGNLPVFRRLHRLRRPADRRCSGSCSTTACSTSSCRSTTWDRSGRRGTGWRTSRRASITRSSSRPARACGRTSSATRSDSSRANPPLLTFTGRTKYTLSAFGEHLISEEVEAGIASASAGDRGVGARLARRAGLQRGARAITSSSSNS